MWRSLYCGFWITFRLTPALLAVVLYYAYIMEHLGTGPQWNLTIKRNADLCKESLWKNILYIQTFFPFEQTVSNKAHKWLLSISTNLLLVIWIPSKGYSENIDWELSANTEAFISCRSRLNIMLADAVRGKKGSRVGKAEWGYWIMIPRDCQDWSTSWYAILAADMVRGGIGEFVNDTDGPAFLDC